jgi:hypothetical protein
VFPFTKKAVNHNINTRTGVLIFGTGQKGRDDMKEKYREMIHRMVDAVADEQMLKKIYTYVLSVTKK